MSRAISVRITTPTPVLGAEFAGYRQRLLNAARAVEEFDHSHDKKWRGKGS